MCAIGYWLSSTNTKCQTKNLKPSEALWTSDETLPYKPLQTITNHYKPVQTYESVGAEECAQGESARRPGGTKHLHPLRGRCDAAATRAKFFQPLGLFRQRANLIHLIHLIPRDPTWSHVFVVFVSHHNSWDTWKMVEDMMLSPMCMPCGAPHPLTSHTTQMFTDAACCYMLHKATCAWNLDPCSVPALFGCAASRATSIQESYGILEGSRLINETGQPFASIMSQTGTRSVPIDINIINWYLRTQFSKSEMVETCMVSTFLELDRNPEVMHFHGFRRVEHEKLQDMSNEILLQERNKMRICWKLLEYVR